VFQNHLFYTKSHQRLDPSTVHNITRFFDLTPMKFCLPSWVASRVSQTRLRKGTLVWWLQEWKQRWKKRLQWHRLVLFLSFFFFYFFISFSHYFFLVGLKFCCFLILILSTRCWPLDFWLGVVYKLFLGFVWFKFIVFMCPYFFFFLQVVEVKSCLKLFGYANSICSEGLKKLIIKF